MLVHNVPKHKKIFFPKNYCGICHILLETITVFVDILASDYPNILISILGQLLNPGLWMHAENFKKRRYLKVFWTEKIA